MIGERRGPGPLMLEPFGPAPGWLPRVVGAQERTQSFPEPGVVEFGGDWGKIENHALIIVV